MEWAVIFWLMIVALVILGGLYLYFGLTAPSGEQDWPAVWVRRGLLFLGTAAGAVLIRWAARWWMNR